MILNYLLIISVLILAIISLINEKIKENEKIIPSGIFLFLIIIVAIIQIRITYQEKQKEKYSADAGSLTLSDLETQNITYRFGSNNFSGYQNKTIIGKDGVFSIPCDKEILSTNIVEGELKISSFLYDKNGHIVAKIVSNEWTVNPKFMWDKNFDTEGFEVVDDKDKVILQIEKHGNVVEINGDFYCNTMRIFANENGTIINPSPSVKSTL